MTKRPSREFPFEFADQTENEEEPYICISQYYNFREPTQPNEVLPEHDTEYYELVPVPELEVEPEPEPETEPETEPEPSVLEEVPQNRKLNTVYNYFKTKCIEKIQNL